MATLVTVEEYEARQAEIRSRLEALDSEYTGRQLPDEARSEWNALNEELEANAETMSELVARRERVLELQGNGRSQERPAAGSLGGARISAPDDPFNLAAYRESARSMDDLPRLYREGARTILDAAILGHDEVDPERAKAHVERLLTRDEERGEIAQRIILTGSPAYRRAFGKVLKGEHLTAEENAALSRAASLTDAAGGYAVPFTLDPTVIPTSNDVVNPIRSLARNVTISGSDEWRGVTATAVVASFDAEASEVSDDTPTFGQPTISVFMARAFIPFSMEIGDDWGAFQTEMARLFQDGKDVLESSKFLSGSGTGEPQGLLTGATYAVQTSAATTLAVGDLYAVTDALPARWQGRASLVANRSPFSRIRQLDTNGGAALWVQLGDGTPARLLGYPTREWSDMSSGTTTGSSLITVGDFTQFVIVDRIGMSIELIPHLFHTSNNRPSGQRGLFARWRVGSGVTVPAAFRTLVLK